MNIAKLLHKQKDKQLIPHWPVFTIDQFSKQWYFYSSHGHTLKKKLQNTSLADFLHMGEAQQQKKQSNNEVLLEVREVDERQPKAGQLYQIKVNKLKLEDLQKLQFNKKEQSLIQKYAWKPSTYERISFYRIIDPLKNQLHILEWSENILRCRAPLNSHLREVLSKYAQTLVKEIQTKFLLQGMKVKKYELLFTLDSKIGKIRIVFAQNFVLSAENHGSNPGDTINEMYKTNFKIGRDQYQVLELEIQRQNEGQKQNSIFNNNQQVEGLNLFKVDLPSLPQFDEKLEKKRLNFMKVLKKVHRPDSFLVKKMDVDLKMEVKAEKKQGFQCYSCYCYVQLNEFQHKNMVSANRITEIQLMRQIKMRKNLNSNCADFYQLVAVCRLCYKKFEEIVESRGSLKNEDVKKGGRDKGQSCHINSIRLLEIGKQINSRRHIKSCKNVEGQEEELKPKTEQNKSENRQKNHKFNKYETERKQFQQKQISIRQLKESEQQLKVAKIPDYAIGLELRKNKNKTILLEFTQDLSTKKESDKQKSIQQRDRRTKQLKYKLKTRTEKSQKQKESLHNDNSTKVSVPYSDLNTTHQLIRNQSQKNNKQGECRKEERKSRLHRNYYSFAKKNQVKTNKQSEQFCYTDDLLDAVQQYKFFGGFDKHKPRQNQLKKGKTEFSYYE